MNHSGDHFRNQEFITLTKSIRQFLPKLYLVGILTSYVINGVLIGVFLYLVLKKIIGHDAALFLSIAGPAAIQLFRFLIIFTDQLFPESGNTAKFWVQIVAALMTAWGIFETYHLLKGHGLNWSEFAGVFGFGASIVAAGWLMEINFIKKVNEFTTSEVSMTFMGKIDGKPVYGPPEVLSKMATLFQQIEGQNPGHSTDQETPKKSEAAPKSLQEPKQEPLPAAKSEPAPKKEEALTVDF